jgi:hypothetical protein
VAGDDLMAIELESMAVEMPEVEGHPNRAEFRGVLTVVDVPSQRAPSGSGGHRVVLTRQAAEEALPSLIGMALDFAPSFDRHDARRKVGVITSAEVVGRNLEVGGYFYAKDFPEVVEEVAKFGRRSRIVGTLERRDGLMQAMVEPGCGREVVRLRASLSAAVEALREVRASASGGKAGGAGLGMSFEVTDAVVADRRAKIWTISHVTFTGAAVLRKDKAAFEDTWIELG